MFFVVLIALVSALLLTNHPPDQAGWMMLVGAGWLAGYLDCRRFARSDGDSDRVMPPDVHEPSSDRVTFES